MSQSIQCPNCNAPLDYKLGGDSVITCSYCRSEVVLLEELRSIRINDPMDVENLIQTDRLARLEEVNDLVAQGNKIAAIKRYRVLFETSLTEAKEAIEQLADGKAITVPQVSVLPEGETNQARSDLVEAEIRRLVQADKKIEASKLNRETFHTGLK